MKEPWGRKFNKDWRVQRSMQIVPFTQRQISSVPWLIHLRHFHSKISFPNLTVQRASGQYQLSVVNWLTLSNVLFTSSSNSSWAGLYDMTCRERQKGELWSLASGLSERSTGKWSQYHWPTWDPVHYPQRNEEMPCEPPTSELLLMYPSTPLGPLWAVMYVRT